MSEMHNRQGLGNEVDRPTTSIAETAPTGPCPVCGGVEFGAGLPVRDNRTGVFGEPFRIAPCLSCGTWALRPMPTPETLSAAYVTGYGPYDPAPAPALGSRLRRALRRGWHLLDGQASIDRLGLVGPVLDVGAGQGRNVALLLALGVEVWGIEPNPMAVEVCRSQGLPVEQGDLGSMRPGEERWATVLLDQVVEHVPDPLETLCRAWALLRPGGRVVITTPNVGGLQCTIFGREWAHWHVPYHVYLYGPSQLRALLERAGFRDVKVRTVSPAFWSAMSARAWAHRSQRSGWVLPARNLQPGLAARLALAPILRAVDVARAGDCLIAEGSK